MRGPMAWYGGERPLAWSDPRSGLSLCLLAHLALASSGKATCSGSHRGREEEPGSQEKQSQQFGPRLVLGWLCAEGKREREVTAGGKIALHLGGTRPGRLGILMMGAVKRTPGLGDIEVTHTSP